MLPPVSTKRTMTTYFSLLLCFILFLTGCTDYKQLKADMMQAVNKQEEIKSYGFSGSIELKADASLLGSTTPLTAALFAFLKDSKIEYKGLSVLDPSQMEAAFKVTPTGGTAIDIPVLIKDSKLFFHIPALNKDDEYMVMPISSKPSSSNSVENAGALKNTGHLSAVINGQLLQGIDPNWLQTSKDPVTLSDGTTAKRITLDINKKNEAAFNDYWIQAVPGITDLLKTNVLVSGAAADSLQTTLKQVKFQAPSTLDLLIDNQGYVHEQKWDLTFTANNSTNVNHLVWIHSLTDLNKAPAFTKDIPAKQKSLDELLKLTKPAPGTKK